MSSWWQTVMDFYHDIMENKSDPRVRDWPMMSGPFPTIFICIFYAYFVKVIGPKFMEKRKPFVLRRVMLYYNLFQIIASAWIFILSLKYGWWNDYSFRCQPVDYSNTPEAIRVAQGCWWYFILKYIELLDTIFFVLRKKNNQVSNLHVYHHAIMPFTAWVGTKFVPGGHSTFFGLLNSFVHIIMYGYYYLAAFGPKMKPYLWWKKYLTTLQLIQFILIMLHAVQLFFIDCDYPIIFVWWLLIQAFIFFYLFRNFYDKSYNKKVE